MLAIVIHLDGSNLFETIIFENDWFSEQKRLFIESYKLKCEQLPSGNKFVEPGRCLSGI